MFDIWACLSGMLSGYIIYYYINQRLNPSFRYFVICKTCNKKIYVSMNVKKYFDWFQRKYKHLESEHYISCLSCKTNDNKYSVEDIQVEKQEFL